MFVLSSFWFDFDVCVCVSVCLSVQFTQHKIIQNHRSLTHTIDWSIEMRNKIDLNEPNIIKRLCLFFRGILSIFVVVATNGFLVCPIEIENLSYAHTYTTHTQKAVDSKSN